MNRIPYMKKPSLESQKREEGQVFTPLPVIDKPPLDTFHASLERGYGRTSWKEVYKDHDEIFRVVIGSKELYVVLDKDLEENEASAQTHVLNRKKERIEGETTIAYTQAKKIMEAYAKRIKKEVFYHFSTGNASMYRWAKGPGKEIFKWDYEPCDEDELDSKKLEEGDLDLIFTVTIPYIPTP
jgi:hypothetical protein